MPIYWQQKFSVFLSFSLFLILVLLSFSVLLRPISWALLRHPRVSFVNLLGLLRHPRVSFISFCISFIIPVSPSSVSVSPSLFPCLLRHSQFFFVILVSSSSFPVLLRYPCVFFVILGSNSSSSFPPPF